MRVYVIRHGESTANSRGVHAGWSQVPLTEKGSDMARALAPCFYDRSVDEIYTSDLIRAIQTAKLVFPGYEPIQDARLREISVGSLSGFSPEVMGEKYGISYWQHKAERDFTAYGGENAEDQLQRVRSFMKELAAKDKQHVAVVCHEGTIQCMLRISCGTDEPSDSTGLGNCSVTVFDTEKNGAWKLIGSMKMQNPDNPDQRVEFAYGSRG